jgi:hypothetical protein
MGNGANAHLVGVFRLVNPALAVSFAPMINQSKLPQMLFVFKSLTIVFNADNFLFDNELPKAVL